jgi:hypothetical protein
VQEKVMGEGTHFLVPWFQEAIMSVAQAVLIISSCLHSNFLISYDIRSRPFMVEVCCRLLTSLLSVNDSVTAVQNRNQGFAACRPEVASAVSSYGAPVASHPYHIRCNSLHALNNTAYHQFLYLTGLPFLRHALWAKHPPIHRSRNVEVCCC